MVKAFVAAVLFTFLLLVIATWDFLPALLSFQKPIDVKEVTAQTSLQTSQVLGDSTATKRIDVDLTTQTLSAFENNQKIHEFKISSGKWDRTPVGTYKIWAKVPKQKMEGGSKALGTYYYLPNVPYVMFFYNDKVKKQLGYSLHGTYWHSNFGYPMSHGCINMKTPEAKVLYNWATIDTEVNIFGKFQYKTASRK